MLVVTETHMDMRLARDGGPRARTRPEHPMYPGGMEIGDEELEAATRVISSKNLFRYYGVGEGPHEVETSSGSSPSTSGRATRSASTRARPR